MQHHHYILSLCQSLSQSGKTPSVALIKSLASHPLPLPAILAVLQKWKKNPDIELPKPRQAAVSPISTEQRLDKLEARMDKLETLLHQLLHKSEQTNHTG